MRRAAGQDILDRLERGDLDIEGALAAFDAPPAPHPPRSSAGKIVLSSVHADATSPLTTSEPVRSETQKKIQLSHAPAPLASAASSVVALTLHEAEAIALVEIRDDASANMLSEDVLAGLRQVFAEVEELAAAGKAKVVIVTGTETWFCCGGTLEDLARMRDGRASFFDVDGFRLLLDCSLPTIAAMRGHAVGGGFTFGLYADVVLLASRAFYSANFMEHGLTPGIGTTYLLPKKLGPTLGAEMMLTAQRYQGRDLRARGVPLEVLEREDVLARAFEIARAIAKHPLPQLKLLKRRGTEAIRRDLPPVLREEDAMHAQCFPRQPTKMNRERAGFAAYSTLVVDRRSSSWVVTIDRPDSRNSINEPLLEELHGILDEIEAEAAAKVLILRGGPPVFSAGLDFRAATASTAIAARFRAVLQRLSSTPKIVIALVDGAVIGGGIGLVAASDFVFATSRSTFALTEALWGLVPATVLPFMIRRTGLGPAYAMTLSAETVTAEAACAMRLVDELLVGDDVLASVEAKARAFDRLEAGAIGTTKTYFRDRWPVDDGAEDVDVIHRLLADPKTQERMRAFSESGQLPWETTKQAPPEPEEGARFDADVFAIVKAKIVEVLGSDVPAASIRPDVSLTDLGASSLDRMEVVSLSMQELGLRFPVRELGKVSNIGELAAALCSKKKETKKA